MSAKKRRLSACNSLLCNCTTIGSLKAEQVISFEKLPSREESITTRLTKLPKIKARQGFDQRILAAFAMELEREILQRNRSWLEKHPKIKLPEIISDLNKDIS